MFKWKSEGHKSQSIRGEPLGLSHHDKRETQCGKHIHSPQHQNQKNLLLIDLL